VAVNEPTKAATSTLAAAHLVASVGSLTQLLATSAASESAAQRNELLRVQQVRPCAQLTSPRLTAQRNELLRVQPARPLIPSPPVSPDLISRLI
jgi:hypothetical protein